MKIFKTLRQIKIKIFSKTLRQIKRKIFKEVISQKMKKKEIKFLNYQKNRNQNAKNQLRNYKNKLNWYIKLIYFKKG